MNLTDYYDKYYIFTGKPEYTGRLVRLSETKQGSEYEDYDYMAVIHSVVPGSDKEAYISVPVNHEELIPHTVH